MIRLFLNWIIPLMLDQRGEDGGDPAAGGEGVGSEVIEGGDGLDNEGGDPDKGGSNIDPNKDPNGGAEPLYGEFGNDAAKLYQAFQGLKGKTTATERNLASTRKSIESLGLKIGEDGTVQLAEGKASTKRFTDEHAKMFEPNVLKAIQGLMEDYIEDHFGRYEQKTTMKQQFVAQKETANSKMVKMFPQLLKEVDDGVNPQFNETFFNRATEIWQTTPGYKSHPSGELYSAMEAAIELGISPIAIAKAKKEGYNKGVSSKKVLGPSGAGAGAQGGAGFKRLSVEEFRKLSSEEKEKYQAGLVNQQK